MCWQASRSIPSQALSRPPLLLLPHLPQVMAATGMKGGGPALGKLMEAAVDWQLAHPGAPADECCAHLQELHAAAAAATQAG